MIGGLRMSSSDASDEAIHDQGQSPPLPQPEVQSDAAGVHPVASPSALFRRSLAVVVGINAYRRRVVPLRSARPDAVAVADALSRDHGFEVWRFLDHDADLRPLLTLLHDQLPEALTADDRLLFYFAGHGIALDSDAGPAGYLVPADAVRLDRHELLPMHVVHSALARLPIRHAFVILDCCFAGTFRWAQTRDVGSHDDKVYRERYEHYIESRAWQVLTSAARDQRALDVVAHHRDEQGRRHSPFASALLKGLAGDADYTKDHVITADELAVYVRERVAPDAKRAGIRQVPQLFSLDRHDGGQFVFQVPNRPVVLKPAPDLDEDKNPYRGLAPFQDGPRDRALFFGRARLVEQLLDTVVTHRLTVVVGASGSGKTSLVQAGVVPELRDRGWTTLPIRRPGREPLVVLATWADVLGATSEQGDRVGP